MAVEITPRKVAWSVVVVGLLALAGTYARGQMQVADRHYQFDRAVRGIGYARGGRLPTDREVEAQVNGFAEAEQIVLRGLRITSHEEAGLGPLGNLVPQLGATLSGRQRVYRLEGQASTQAFFVSSSWALTQTISLRSHVEGPSRPMPSRDFE